MYVNKPKDHLIQVTNQDLNKLSKEVFVQYKGRKLYVDFLIDLLHGFYDKAIRHGKPEIENPDSANSRFCIFLKLNSRILLKKYGRHYKSYIDYLIENKYISYSHTYVTSKRSNTYKLIHNINPKEIVYYKNFDSSKHKRLLKFYNEEVNLIPHSVRIKDRILRQTIDNLRNVSIEQGKALEILKSIYPDENSNKFYRNQYCIKTIANDQIYLVPDEYGRMHTNFTVLKKEIRNSCLKIDNERIYERDVRNSQPFFLLKLMADEPQFFKNIEGDLRIYYELVSTGYFYEEVNKIYPDKSREDVKKWIMMVFFNRNYFHDIDFFKAFPTIYGFIKNIKNENGYKSLAHRLQNIESDFIFNQVCSKLFERDIKYFTVHDSICVKDSDKIQLNKIFDNEFQSYLHEVEVKLFFKNNI